MGRKMSKSLGQHRRAQDVIKQSGADILRLWALSSDYTEDLRIGPHIIQSTVDAYRKLRNTMRYLLGNLPITKPGFEVAHADMPELERWVLHRVAEIDAEVRAAYNDFDFKKAYRLLAEFCSNDLSAIYFDIRKDTLYCEPYSSVKRRGALFGAEYAVRKPDGVACPAAVLHGRGGLACAPWRAEEWLRSFAELPENPRGMARTMRLARNGRRSGPFAA